MENRAKTESELGVEFEGQKLAADRIIRVLQRKMAVPVAPDRIIRVLLSK